MGEGYLLDKLFELSIGESISTMAGLSHRREEEE